MFSLAGLRVCSICSIWLPAPGNIRTFFTFTIFAGTKCTARKASQLAYRFDDGKPSVLFDPPGTAVHSRTFYRNPIIIAQEWQRMLGTQECASQADLVRTLGVFRARVTQVLGLIALAPEVVQALAALGDPLPKPLVTERKLRAVFKLPAKNRNSPCRELSGRSQRIEVQPLSVMD